MASSKEVLCFFHAGREIRAIQVEECPDEKAVCELCGKPVHGSTIYMTDPPDELHVHAKCAKDWISPFLSHRSPTDPSSSSRSPDHPYSFSYLSSSSPWPSHHYPHPPPYPAPPQHPPNQPYTSPPPFYNGCYNPSPASSFYNGFYNSVPNGPPPASSFYNGFYNSVPNGPPPASSLYNGFYNSVPNGPPPASSSVWRPTANLFASSAFGALLQALFGFFLSNS